MTRFSKSSAIGHMNIGIPLYKTQGIISAVKHKAYNDDGNGVQHKVATIKV